MRILLLLILAIPLTQASAQRPVIFTDDAVTLGSGRIEAGIGLEYFEKHVAPSPRDPENLYRLVVIAWHQGVAQNVNFDLDWRGGLLTKLGNGTRGFHWGELTISTRINFLRERRGLPAIGLRSAVKLPNTLYDDYKLGSNQTDYHAQILLCKQYGSVQARLNVGFSILGDPRVAGIQNDVYHLSGVLLIPLVERARVFVELFGVTGYQDHSNKVVTRFGSIIELGKYEVDLYGSLRAGGNNRDFGAAFENSENWSVGLMVRRVFEFDL